MKVGWVQNVYGKHVAHDRRVVPCRRRVDTENPRLAPELLDGVLDQVPLGFVPPQDVDKIVSGRLKDEFPSEGMLRCVSLNLGSVLGILSRTRFHCRIRDTLFNVIPHGTRDDGGRGKYARPKPAQRLMGVMTRVLGVRVGNNFGSANGGFRPAVNDYGSQDVKFTSGVGGHRSGN